MPVPTRPRSCRPPVLAYTTMVDADGPYRLYTVTEKAATANILPGLKTPVYGYNGAVPGPIVKVPQGTRVKLRVRNQLPALHPTFGHPFNTSTHLHGSASLPQYDGYANDVTHPGDYKDYLYPNWQPARTLWYHDHNVMTTAQNAYSGPRRAVPPDRRRRAGPAAAGQLRRPDDHHRRDVRGRRVARLRRQQPLGPVGRRHPRQRQAVAGDEGQADDLPLPGAQRLHRPVASVCG